MNLLINEPPLQVLPTLAKEIGLNEAIVVQQVHYWIRISKNERDGFIWVYKTFEEWNKEFPFWSVRTIQRIFKELEEKELLYSSKIFNRAGYDRTKWYRINYAKLTNIENDTLSSSKVTSCRNGKRQNGVMENDKLSQCITREYTENTTDINNVEKLDNASAVYKNILEHLNKKANTNYRHTTKKTQQLIKARFAEGFTVDDFLSVIDKKVSEWQRTEFEKFLRPETLFGTKFESYLEQPSKTSESTHKQLEKQAPQNSLKPFNFGE